MFEIHIINLALGAVLGAEDGTESWF
jgi:hypothetical protein